MKTGPITIQLTMEPAGEELLEELVAAVNASPDPDIAKTFLNDKFFLAERIDDLFSFVSSPAVEGVVRVSIRKTDLYFELVRAIKMGRLDAFDGKWSAGQSKKLDATIRGVKREDESQGRYCINFKRYLAEIFHITEEELVEKRDDVWRRYKDSLCTASTCRLFAECSSGRIERMAPY